MTTYQFPRIEKKEWRKVFPEADPLLLRVLDRVMIFSPHERATAIEVLSMEYFNELRDQLTYSHISSMYHLLDFFNFSREEMFDNEHLVEKLIPGWYRQR